MGFLEILQVGLRKPGQALEAFIHKFSTGISPANRLLY